jgi:hypothetical protein
MNADQATCGYGCSGNPYDAYWAFDPVGHGDVHEVGHNIENRMLGFEEWDYHSIQILMRTIHNQDTILKTAMELQKCVKIFSLASSLMPLM